MKKLLGIVVPGLLLSGCAPTYDASTGRDLLYADVPEEEAQRLADAKCKSSSLDGKSKATKVTLRSKSHWFYDCETTLTKEELARIAKEKEILANEMAKKKRQKKIAQLEILYKEVCLDSTEYEKCLFNKEKINLEKQKALEKKLAAMSPKDRHAYNCSETFKFKKGTEKFNDCVFKLYTAELDLQKLELEKEVAEAKIKAAATEQARAEAVANAQIAAAKSAKRSSDLNNSIQLMKLGSSLLGGSTSSSSSNNSFDINNRTRTTCRVVGGFLNCY